jgi:two-component system, NtrC family, sensor kinase
MHLPLVTKSLELRQFTSILLSRSWEVMKRRSFGKRQKLAIASLLGTTIAVGAIAGVSYGIVRSIILMNLQQKTLLKTRQEAQSIDQWLSNRQAELATISHSPILRTQNWEQIEPYIRDEAQRIEEFFFFLYAEPSGFLGSSKDGILKLPFFDRDWYKKAIEGKWVISDPTISRSTGEVIVRISSPVLDSQRRPKAVLSGGITVKRVLDVVSCLKQGEGSYGFALNSQGVAIAHPDPKLVSTPESPAHSLLQSPNPALASIARRMVDREEGIELISMDGKNQYVVFSPLQQAEWSIALVVPQDAIESHLNALNILALVLGGLLGFGLLVAWQQVQAFEKSKIQTAKLNLALSSLQTTQAQLIHSEKMSSLGKMVAGIAHEINNPINFVDANLNHTDQHISNLLELIQAYQNTYPDPTPSIIDKVDEIDLPFIQDDLPKIMNSMKNGSDRIRDIVLSLRSFSRLDESAYKPVNLHQGIDDALMLLQHRLKGDGHQQPIVLSKKYGELPLVHCYASEMNQVFLNLLSNAIDALALPHPSTSSSQRIRGFEIEILTESVTPSFVRIQIADHGCGIEADILPKIFDPFFTTKPVGSGTGLGLAISHQVVVNQHHGKLWCDSKPGEGTRFTLEIPVMQ